MRCNSAQAARRSRSIWKQWWKDEAWQDLAVKLEAKTGHWVCVRALMSERFRKGASWGQNNSDYTITSAAGRGGGRSNHELACRFDGNWNTTTNIYALPLKRRPRHLFTDLRAIAAPCDGKKNVTNCFMIKRMLYTCVCALPSEMPLDRVELSAWHRLGLWLSITLSSSRWREPALGNVALLNSTVFILWMKLARHRKVVDHMMGAIKSHPKATKYWLVAQAVALPVAVGQQVPGWRRCGRYFGRYCTFTAAERRGWCLLTFKWESGWGEYL